MPYDVQEGKYSVVKKGTFPRPPGTELSVTMDDGGIDEDAIRAAILRTHSLALAAVAENFSGASRLALQTGLEDLMRSAGTTGGPREDWEAWDMDAAAVSMYDAAILLWLESGEGGALPKVVRDGHLERMRQDSKRREEIARIARQIERGGIF